MAEKIALELEVKGITSVKDLRQSIKDAKNELLQFEVGSEGFSRAQKKVSELTDKLDGLGDSARLQGTGVERLGQSFSLLGQSFRSGDLDKGKLALTGIGQAVSAIPMFLLLEGFNLLIQNFDKLLEFIPGLQGIVDVFNELTDAIGLTNHAQNKLYEDAVNNSKRATEATVAYYDKEIALLKAAGQETFLLEQQKREEFRKTLDDQAKVIQDKALRDKKLTDEQLKQLEELDKAQKASLIESEVAEIEYGVKIKKEREDLFKHNQELRKQAAKEAEEKRLADDALFNEALNRGFANQEAEIKASQDKAARLEEIQRQQDDKEYAQRIRATKERIALTEQEAAKEIALKQQVEAAKRTATTNGINAANILSKAYFQNQLNQAKGNAQAETEIRKKQFEVEKAFSIARAVIDGVRSVQGALAQTATLGPAAIVLATANGILAAANVAQIAATNFDGGSSADVAAASPTTSLPQSTGSVPTVPNFGDANSTQLNGGNNNINQTNTPLTVRAYVVESEITQSQSIINREKRAASFG